MRWRKFEGEEVGTSELEERDISKPEHFFRQQRARKAMNKLLHPNIVETSQTPFRVGHCQSKI